VVNVVSVNQACPTAYRRRFPWSQQVTRRSATIWTVRDGRVTKVVEFNVPFVEAMGSDDQPGD
jgi:hypothetical protein